MSVLNLVSKIWIVPRHELSRPCSQELSFDQWSSVLKLSTMWMFLDLRQTAIEKLLSFPTTPQTVVLGCTYSSIELFDAGCTGLIDRPYPISISDDEAMVLGYEMAFRLCILREKKFQYEFDPAIGPRHLKSKLPLLLRKKHNTLR